MTAPSRAEIMRETQHLSADAMKELLRKKYGISAADFAKTMRQILPKESYYQRKIMEALSKQYPRAFIRKLSAGPYSEGGMPDILMILDGKYYGFEVKRPYLGTVSALQQKAIDKINAAGGCAIVCRFPQEAIDAVETNRNEW